jgi:cyclophilin family peptidyl-prolyl cis-trans isomerase/HEAT repeat protein
LTRAHAAAASLAAFLAVSCAGTPPPSAPSKDAADAGTDARARLLEAEDTRTFDPSFFGRAAASPDPGLRSRTALAAGRLKDPEAAALLPALLGDPDPSVRRAAAFAAGISGDPKLVGPCVAALADPDSGTAELAAEALGKLGGDDATAALLAALGRPGRARAAAAQALFRADDPKVASALALVALDPAEPADLRAAAVYSLARRPRKESLPALRAVLRQGEKAGDPDVVAWSARAAGLLGDTESVPDLVRLAASANVSVAVQSLLALEKILSSPKAEALAPEASGVASKRSNDPLPGVAVAALRLEGALPPAAASRAVLEEALHRGGWQGQTALVSLTRLDAPGDPDRAAGRLAAAAESGSLELKLGACEALEFLAAGLAERAGAALLADPSPRVRAAALSSLAKTGAPNRLAILAGGLKDPSPSVRAAALEAAAPLVDGVARPLLPSWIDAYERSFPGAEPDDVVTALDAAAARGEAGRPLVAARVDDPEPVVRDKARRVMVATWGAVPGGFRRIPVKTGRTAGDYRALARMAGGFGAEVAFVTPRGAFTVELDFGAAPATAFSFYALAKRGFFDGLVLHRVVPDFVVQTGDPRGDGTGGPGYAIRDEINPLRYRRGAVGMALSGADTGGSQWFVALSPQPHLDGGYTVFGRVSSGMDVLDRAEQDDPILRVRVRGRPSAPGAGAAR